MRAARKRPGPTRSSMLSGFAILPSFAARLSFRPVLFALPRLGSGTRHCRKPPNPPCSIMPVTTSINNPNRSRHEPAFFAQRVRRRGLMTVAVHVSQEPAQAIEASRSSPPCCSTLSGARAGRRLRFHPFRPAARTRQPQSCRRIDAHARPAVLNNVRRAATTSSMADSAPGRIL